MKFTYFFLGCCLLITTEGLRAQKLSYSDVKSFWFGMEVKRSSSDFVKASSYHLMEGALFDLNGSEPQISDVLGAFETFLSHYNLCEEFFFEAVKSQNGEVENARMLLYGLSGNMQASIHIVDFIKYKYRVYFKNLESKKEKEEQNYERPKDSETAPTVEGGINKKNFENDGLKYEIKITIQYSSESKVYGTVTSDEYDDDNVNRADFIGTIKNNVLKIKFLGDVPKTGDEWPNKPWEIKKVGGKEILYVVLTSRDSETNKWTDYPVPFYANEQKSVKR